MTHINIIKILDYIGGVISIILGLIFGVIFFVGAGAVGLSGEEGSAVGAIVFGSFAIVIAGICIVMGALTIFAGMALGSFKSWSKWYHVIVAVMNIANFPIGTAYGAYVLWALFANEEVKTLFERGGY